MSSVSALQRRLSAAILLLAPLGCAGEVNGAVSGTKLAVVEAIFTILEGDRGEPIGAFVVMSDKPKVCESLKGNRLPKSSNSLLLTLYTIGNSDYEPPEVAEFTVIEGDPSRSGDHASAEFVRTDTNCIPQPGTANGRSGVVNLTWIKAEANGTATGPFQITFGTGDEVKGGFNATYCDTSGTTAAATCL